MYSMATIVTDTVLYLKATKRANLKKLSSQEKNSITLHG